MFKAFLMATFRPWETGEQGRKCWQAAALGSFTMTLIWCPKDESGTGQAMETREVAKNENLGPGLANRRLNPGTKKTDKQMCTFEIVFCLKCR